MNPRWPRIPSLPQSVLLATLGLGALSLAPTPAEAALSTTPSPVELAPLPKPQTRVAKTKAGTEIPIWMWAGSEWTGSADWFPSPKVSAKPATGEVVMIVFDAGDGVSIAPVIQMFRAMGATVVAFDNPLVGFDNPLAGFDNPLVGFENPLVGREEGEGDMGVAQKSGIAGETHEYSTDVLQAMITWAANHAIGDGKRHRVHLFGVGRGADLALQVGATRTSDLRSITVDSPSLEAAKKFAKTPLEDSDAFFGVRVVRTASSKLASLQAPSLTVASSATKYPKATVSELASNGSYQRAIAGVVAHPDDQDW